MQGCDNMTPSYGFDVQSVSLKSIFQLLGLVYNDFLCHQIIVSEPHFCDKVGDRRKLCDMGHTKTNNAQIGFEWKMHSTIIDRTKYHKIFQNKSS